MITGVGTVAVLVRDAKASAQWYHEKLGFEIVAAQGHAVFVRPAKSSFPLLHLCEECDSWGSDRPGGTTGIWFPCSAITFQKAKSGELLPASNPDEVEKTYHELQSRGVRIAHELRTTSWGKMATFLDLDGNEFEIS